MFGRIAPSYDLANHLLSGGIDFWWRHQAAQIAAGWQPSRLLDLATGSGDLALAIQRKSPTTEITAADVSREMLAVAREKGVKNTVVADALDLPFNDNCFDAVTVAFGLRNMADWDAAVSEMARVLTIDGNLLVLDFSLPAGLLGGIYRTYLHRCLPALAGLVTGERDAYSYLGASIENFPSGTGMINLLERHGFVAAKARALTGGVASIYLARKPNVS
jgi:demethylmenaquinone methyltransferase/2-methoxy-6-polyprenyl-1,4-benzoquinol methylase